MKNNNWQYIRHISTGRTTAPGPRRHVGASVKGVEAGSQVAGPVGEVEEQKTNW